MDDDIVNDLTFIQARWGSERTLNSFLAREVGALCGLICGRDVAVPRVEVRPSFLARGLFGKNSRAAEYIPDDDSNTQPTIIMLPAACESREKARLILAHELIHHWEHTSDSPALDRYESHRLDSFVSSLFSNGEREQRWRGGHSRVFISKAALVANQLQVDLRNLLFE